MISRPTLKERIQLILLTSFGWSPLNRHPDYLWLEQSGTLLVKSKKLAVKERLAESNIHIKVETL